MISTSNFFHKISINILLLTAIVFVYQVFSEMMLVQKETERAIEMSNLETKEQCRQWVEENRETILRMPQYTIDCNRGSLEVNNNYKSSNPRKKRKSKKR
ncbi:MAG: hypothetical protein MUD14_05640 [Hydrococcus sp. Prado102]|jgi:hypothetical protein|nr:hypothetical protein [Hydrococcus sp. Prado102]